MRVIDNNMTALYSYRADGLRHQVTTTGQGQTTVRTHIWNTTHIVLELNDNGAAVNRFMRGIGGHLIRSEHHGWYLFNARGDVIQRVGSQGNILHTYMFDAFGNEANYDPANTNPFRFNAEYWDWWTGTYYLRARNYNPRTGRFTQEDPHWGLHNMVFGDSPTMRNNRYIPSIHSIMQAGNLYMYVMHNPVFWIDPSGLSAGTTGFMPTGFPPMPSPDAGGGDGNRITIQEGSVGSVYFRNTIIHCNTGILGTHMVTTKISITLEDTVVSVSVEYVIRGGAIHFDFPENNYEGVMLLGGRRALATAMYTAGRYISSDFLSHRTIGGLDTELYYHWVPYAFIPGLIPERINVNRAHMGGINPNLPGFDNNAMVFEGMNVAKVIDEFRRNPFSGWSGVRDMMRLAR